MTLGTNDLDKGNVELDPGITIHPAPSVVIAQKNSPLLLNCSASSSPDAGPVTITWYKDGQPVLIDRRVQVRDNGSLYFTQVKNNRHSRNKNRNQNGFYECFMKNKYGTVIARQVHLQVASISKSFTIEPANQKVELGAWHDLNVKLMEYLIQFMSGRKTVYLYLRIAGILQIHNISESDAGSFHCSVYQSLNRGNNVAEIMDMTWQDSRFQARLKVVTDTERRPPMIVAISKEVNATIKHSVTLECLADGNPSPVVTWMKDGNQTSDDNFNTMFDRSNIKLIKVDKNDAGTYQCVASSPGFPDAVAETELNIQVPPFIIKDQLSKEYPVARWFRLKCTVGGAPTPEVTWYKNGQKIASLENMQVNPDHMLLIDSSISDSGYYQCIAKNDVGVDMAITRLQIILKGVCIRWFPPEYPKCCHALAYTVVYGDLKDVPVAVSNLRLSSSSPCSIDLKWDPLPPEICDGVITRYQIYVSKGGHDIMKNVSTAKHKYTIRDLHPGTEYKVRVLAGTEWGSPNFLDHKWSWFEHRTPQQNDKPQVPKAAPNMRLYSSSPFSIDVEWDPVLPRNAMVLTQDLLPNTNYKIRVLSGTADGYPNLLDEQWPWLIHKTPKDNEIPQVDVQIQVSQLNLTCVDVKWNITDNQPSISYKIDISNTDARTVEIQNIKMTNYIICGLDKNLLLPFMLGTQLEP
ncbi:unnamed protein product [Mytilus edulis]|uniref:Uncharacterized protein n=1 Tax=Mytilus edulis TaxID=6550 RepID=A0A8S3T5F5_MYTED|nr:unnamed protein product [Mytilus edulis]